MEWLRFIVIGRIVEMPRQYCGKNMGVKMARGMQPMWPSGRVDVKALDMFVHLHHSQDVLQLLILSS
jgi:hypothetical protein